MKENETNLQGSRSRQNIEDIFNNLKDYIDKIKDNAIASGKKEDASSSLSFIGMIFDEISNSLKKDNSTDINGLTGDLDDEIKIMLNGLNSFKSEKIVVERLDGLAVYCDKVFMELMAGVSCAIPAK
ncbi:MAG: hypothetical protein M0016_07010 [Deltaproteobacteria bacterium]|jgi:hypothetical protein|nr:hypothetical protein [Deltaproteobacteria bacterium]MCL5880594.1 hypothetical protein [Deltaproteobacteria bacterium]MDA8304895.1 hypothetical protein [Deltaproteobacteria bacterium]